MNYLNRCLTTIRKTLPLLLKHPGQIKYVSKWWSSLDHGKSPLGDERPWIAFSAECFLGSITTKDMTVYEYGSGGSTLFFARRACKVISAEHDSNWYVRVVEQVNNKGLSNCNVRLFAPENEGSMVSQEPDDPDSYSSSDANYTGMSFRKYAASIDGFPDAYFDIVFIDGRSRPSCFKHALRKVKRGGFLVLDNAEDTNYAFIHNSLRNKARRKYDFVGLFPYMYHFSKTSVWQLL